MIRSAPQSTPSPTTSTGGTLPDYRVLITSSRNWAQPGLVRAVLDMLHFTVRGRYRLVVVHGKCRTGGDHHAAMWVADMKRQGHDVDEDPHPVTPAEWDALGRAAGPRRNQRMVDKGAEAALVFNRNNSQGTSGCRDMAQRAGIPFLEWTDNDR